MTIRYEKMAMICLLLGACVQESGNPEAINDPAEPVNRAVHALNKGLDTVALKPASQVYGLAPEPAQDIVKNATSNLDLPGYAVNHVLQGDGGAAARTAMRFFVNSTIGLAGTQDFASDAGLVEEATDFGETLHTWGVGEGPYVELPLLGPSTGRDATGRAVDIAMNPLRLLADQSGRNVLTAATGLGIVDTRHRYSNVIDPTLYDSADSYAAARIAYLQNRRRALKGEIDEDDLEDPFAFDE